MYIDLKTLGTIAGLIVSLIAIASAIFALYRKYLKQAELIEEITKMKSEQCLMTWGLLAALKGLKEQGCNGPVTEAINRIEKHLNKQAHDMEE